MCAMAETYGPLWVKQCSADSSDVLPDEVQILQELSDMEGLPKVVRLTYLDAEKSGYMG